MHHIVFFYIIVAILIFDYLLEQILDYLNATKRSAKLPEELKGIYDKEKYRKSQEYDRSNHKLSIVTSTFNLGILLIFLSLSGFAYVDQIARSITSNPIFVALIFFGIIMFASDIINTPFSIYDTFVIEEKFGFNKTTPKLFILDLLKSMILCLALGIPLLSAICWLLES